MVFQEYYAAALRHGWFDPCFYFDVLQSRGISIGHADLSLFEHYATIGWRRGLSPSIRFSVVRYLAEYHDVADRQVDPLYHYLARGRRERRKAFALFEWPEGVQFAWVAASRRLVQPILVSSRLPVIFLCDGTATGEQGLMRRLIASLGQAGGIECFVVANEDPEATERQRHASWFSLSELDGSGWSREQKVDYLAELLGARGDLVVVSGSLATADLLAPFAARRHRIVSLLHEIPAPVELPAFGAAIGEIKRCTQLVVVSSDLVREQISAACAITSDGIQVVQPPTDLNHTPSWARYVEDVGDCLRRLGNEGRRIRLTGSTLGSQEIADDLCVVIPSYNHKQFILSALDSILAQSVRPKEIRIIDDGSNDGSAELVRSLACDKLGISVRVRENRGAPATINEGIAETACPIVAVMNSDDLWHPLRIERLIAGPRRSGCADVVFSGVRFIGPQHRCENKRSWFERGVADYRNGSPLWLALMYCNFFFTTSNFIARRQKFLELGGFGPLRYCHDLDYMLKAILAGHRVQFVEQTLCEYRLHARNTIDEDWPKVLFEEAWIIAKFLQRNYSRSSESERLSLARCVCAKGLATRVLAILRAIMRNAGPFDAERVHTEPRLAEISQHSRSQVRDVVEPIELVHEMAQIMSAQGAEAP